MKRILFSLFFFSILFSGFSFAQVQIGYVDSDTIMEKLPDAQDARQKLDGIVKEWQDELNKLEGQWKAKYDDYERRKLIMTDQTRAEMEQELVKMEQEISSYREKKFGTNGELFKKQDEIMKPVQNKVFTAIQDLAEELELDFVFDRSGDIMLLYAKPQHDITAQVMEKLQLE